MKPSRFLIIFLTLLLFSVVSKAQNCTEQINGTVTDSLSGEPLPGALVQILEEKQGVSTDAKGQFVLRDLCRKNYRIQITFIGYEPKILSLSAVSSEKLRILLREKTSLLKAVELEAADDSESTLAAITVESLSETELFETQENSLAESLERIPGVNSMNVGIGVTKPVIRGMSMSRVAVNESGIKQQGQQWNSDHGLEIDPLSVGKVRVLRGPASLRFGSDAIGGVVDIEPRAIPDTDGIGGELIAQYQDVNRMKSVSTVLEGRKESFFIQARVTHRRFSDYRVPADAFSYNTFLLPIFDEKLKNTAGKELHGMLSFGRRSEKDEIRFNLSSFDQKIGVFPGATGFPRAYQLDPDGDDNIVLPKNHTRHFKASVNYDYFLSDDTSLEVNAGWQLNKRLEESIPDAHLRPRIGEIGNTARKLDLQTFSLDAVFTAGNRKVGLQTERQQNTIGGFEFMIPAYEQLTAGLFMTQQWELRNNLTFQGGLRYDFGMQDTEAHIDSFYTERSGEAFRSEAVTRRYHNLAFSSGIILSLGKYTVKSNLGSVFRLPNIAELSANGVNHGTFRHEQGQNDLDSERGLQFDLSLSREGEKFSFGITPFVAWYDNFIYLRPMARFSPLPEGGQIYLFSQTEALNMGAELWAEYHIFDFWELYAAFDGVRNQNIAESLPLPFTPPPSALLESKWNFFKKSTRFENTFLRCSVRLTSNQNRTDRNENKTPGFAVFNAEVGTEYDFSHKAHLQILFKAKNLSDRFYFKHLSRYRLLNIPEPGRNFMLSMRFVF